MAIAAIAVPGSIASPAVATAASPSDLPASSAAAASRPTTTTRAPAATHARAADSPSPAVPPMVTIDFPSSRTRRRLFRPCTPVKHRGHGRSPLPHFPTAPSPMLDTPLSPRHNPPHERPRLLPRHLRQPPLDRDRHVDHAEVLLPEDRDGAIPRAAPQLRAALPRHPRVRARPLHRLRHVRQGLPRRLHLHRQDGP